MGQFEKSDVDSGTTLSSLGKASVTYAKDGKTLEDGLKGTIDVILGATNETEALTVASEVFGTKGAVRMVDAIKRGTFSLDALGNTAEQSTGKVSQTFEDTLDPIDEMTVAQNNLTFGLSELSPTIQQIIIIVGGLMADFSVILPVITGVVEIVMTFGSVLLPVIAIVAAIIAGITGLFLIFQNWGTVIEWVRELLSIFGVDIDAIWAMIQ